MTFTPSIQSLIGAHTGIGQQCAIDWARNNVFVPGSDTGYLTSNGLITGTEQAFKSLSTYTSPVGNSPGGFPPIVVDGNGCPYENWLQHDGGGWIKADGTTLTQLAAGGSGSGPPAGFILVGGSACVITYSSTQYILASGETGLDYVVLFDEVTYANLNTTYGSGITGNSVCNVCAGKTGTQYGFVIYGPQSGTDTQKVFVEKVDVTGPTMTPLTSFLPTDINGSWTALYGAGICMDQTDGNPIIWFQNNGTQGAMVKIDQNTGAIIWNVSAPVNAGNWETQFSQSNITHQSLAIITGPISPLVTIFNTSNGSSTSFSSGLAGVFPDPQQCYNDTLGCIVLATTFSQRAGSPTLLNSTPVNFNGWAALYVNPGFTPPSVTRRRFLAEAGPIRVLA